MGVWTDAFMYEDVYACVYTCVPSVGTYVCTRESWRTSKREGEIQTDRRPK